MSKEIRSVVGRYVRVFLAAFIASFSVDQYLIGTEDVRMTLLKSAIAAGISAAFKAWREADAGDKTKAEIDKSVVQNLPL